MWKLAAVAPLLLALAACTDGGSTADEGAPAASENASGESGGGAATWADESVRRGGLFQGENILINPADFERVGVDSAASSGPRMIDVTLDSDGAEVVQKLSTEASEAGESARLVTKSDGDILSAVRVQGSLQGESLQMAVPEDVDANVVVSRLNGDEG